MLITPRGPIIGPALGDEYGAISLRATWLDARPARGLLDVHRVHSFGEFRQALYPWPATPQNVVYADASGAIGWQLMGDIPIRRKGSGALPLPGWDPEVGWEEEPVSLEQTPCLVDPACGYLATANTRPTPEGEGPFWGVDFINGYRLARIIEALDARHDWDVEAVQALQLDQVCLPWREMREVVLAVPAATTETRRAQAMLGAWDGVLRADSPAAALYEMFVSEMAQRVARAAAPRAGAWALGSGTSPLDPPHAHAVAAPGPPGAPAARTAGGLVCGFWRTGPPLAARDRRGAGRGLSRSARTLWPRPRALGLGPDPALGPETPAGRAQAAGQGL